MDLGASGERQEIAPFRFEGHSVRATVQDGEPWFVGKDVCGALEIANHNDALSRLDADERKGVAIADPLGKNKQTLVCISEPGVYRLVFTSRVPKAEAFKRWLAHDVLPSIRRTGSYSTIPVAAHERRTSARIPDAIRLKTNVDRLEKVADRLEARRPTSSAVHPDAPVTFGSLLEILGSAYQSQFMPGARKDSIATIRAALEDRMGNWFDGSRRLQPPSSQARARRPRVKAGRISLAEAARRKERLADMLRADPSLTHNQVARALGICYVTAQRWRREIAVNDNAAAGG